MTAETPPAQQAAIEALRSVSSNLQKNRDGTVRFVRLSKPVVTDEHLTHLRAFRQLDYLAVVTPTVTDAGLANVAELTDLDTLYLSRSGLTDRGMRHLANLQKLEYLYVDETKVSDAGLSNLAQLSRLKTLTLDDTRVSDAGLSKLEKLSDLQQLSLAGTRVSDAGLPAIAKLADLRVLVLDRTAVGGDGLRVLGQLEKLEELSLCGLTLGATGVNALEQLAGLKRVLLYETDIGSDALQAIRAALPKTRFYADTPEPQSRSPWQRLLAGERLREATPVLATSDETAATARDVDSGPHFQRHIVPLLGRLGCNGHACHGSFQGQGGFRLSMFGYQFAADHEALTGGRWPRVDVTAPEDSLLLIHPTTEDHGGGVRFEKGGPEYQRLKQWIQHGARGVQGPPHELVRLEVTPGEIVFDRPEQQVQLKAVALWSDGVREDVTSLVRFHSNDDAVADVSRSGQVTSRRPGETWIISYYDRGVFQTPVILPVSRLGRNQAIGPGKKHAGVATAKPQATGDPRRSGDRGDKARPPVLSKIDQLVEAKLNKLGMDSSGVCSDEAFLRRASLDIAGTLPTADQVRQFLTDRSPDKRARKIDELLETPAYAQWWAMWLSDLTGCNAQYLGGTDMNRSAADQWNGWLLRRVRDNVGWDQVAAGMILAESRRPGQTYESYAAEQSSYMRRKSPEDFGDLNNSMHYYWFRSNNQQPADRALSFGYIFLGVRLQCAQCHKHPFDQWSKDDFDRFTQFFTRIKAGAADDARETQRQLKSKLGVPTKLDTAALRRQMYQRVASEGLPIPWNEIWIEPASGKPHIARLPGGADVDLSAWRDPREPLVAWLLDENNPYFAPSFVNRVWQRYFGVGIVDPPDDFNQANPPSNRALLDWLSSEFIRRKYDMKWLHRTIANSRAYQRDWRPNTTNRTDTRNFSHAQVRRLPAEVTVDAIMQATASDERSAAWATDLRDRKIGFHPISIQAYRLDYSLLVFGKPLRTTNCDCERQAEPTLLQSLYVRNDDEVNKWLNRKQGWLAGIGNTSQEPPVEQLIESAYLRTVSRRPTADEVARARRHLDEVDSPHEALRDLMWALVNTREFLTNH